MLAVPSGCPTGEEFGEAFVSDPAWADPLPARLLDSEVSAALPDGGCAYAVGAVGIAESSGVEYQRVIVYYFNLDTPNRPSRAELRAWGESAGGLPAEETDLDGAGTGEYSDRELDLPDRFTYFTGASVSWVDGETTTRFDDDSSIPAFTQGASGSIEFFLRAVRIDAIRALGDSGAETIDPRAALAQGLRTSFSTTYGVSDEEGYTASFQLSGHLEPFVPDVADSPPGMFEAMSSSVVRGQVTNTTSGRNTDTPGAAVWALYPRDSAACTGYNGISVEGADWQDPSFCTLVLGSVAGARLGPDTTQEFEEAGLALKQGPFEESSTALQELNAPVAVYVVFGGAGRGLTGVDWTADVGCHVRTTNGGTWAVAMAGWPEVLCV